MRLNLVTLKSYILMNKYHMGYAMVDKFCDFELKRFGKLLEIRLVIKL